MKRTIIFFIFLVFLVQPVTSTNVTFSIIEPSNTVSAIFTLVPPSGYYSGGGLSVFDEQINVTPSTTSIPTIFPTVRPPEIPTPSETLQEEVGINQTTTKDEDDNILLVVCFLAVVAVLFLSFVFLVSKRAKFFK